MNNPGPLNILTRHTPVLDSGFVPAALWNRAFRELCDKNPESEDFSLALERTDGTVSVFQTRILPNEGDSERLNLKYTERILKFLLWQKGGCKVYVAGNLELFELLSRIYAPGGIREFDYFFCEP